MKIDSRSTRSFASLSLATALAALLLPARIASAQSTEFDLYNNPVEFAKLSNAAQNLLIARFGQQIRYDEKGNVILPPPPMSHLPLRRGAIAPKTLGDDTIANVLGNVLVNDPTADATAQDTQSESALVLGSGSNIIAGFNDSGSYLGGLLHFTGWAYSSDGGATWTDPGVLPGANDAGDPVLARDNTTGRTYYACLFFSGAGINVFRSDNDGASWMPAVNGTPGGLGFQDKEWMTVDNFPGVGNGNVYLVSRDFGGGNGIFFYRSTDQGATFGPNGGFLIATGSPVNVQGAYVVVGPNHEVYAFWYDANVVPADIKMRKSLDRGVTFGPPSTVTPLISNQVNGNLSLVAGFRSNSFPIVTVNPVSGHLYLLYNDPSAVSGGDRGNIFLRVSTDGGATWSAPMMVNDDGTTRAQYFPSVACRPDGTGLAVCWYDNRSDPMDRNIERWGATATISGSTVTFGPNFRISRQFPPVFGVDPVVNPSYMGDYDQMAADNSLYYTTWGDNRDDSIAVPGRKNANVRFTSFGPEGPGAIIDLGAHTITGGNLNGRIDVNECNELYVGLSNNGGQPATGVSAVLSTVTPGVTILDAMQPYGDLLAGETVVNAEPYRVSTSPAFPCGTPIQFTLTVTSSVGSGILAFSVATGGSSYLVASDTDSLMGGALDVGNHGDDVVTPVSLPFPVTYYSSTFNSVNVSSNGNVQFSGASAAYSNTCLPDGFLNNMIAVHWDDLRTDGFGSGIFMSVSGVAPNRTFHLEWRTTYYSGSGTANFELRLHENSSSFDMVYGNIGQNAASATIGCQQGAGPTATTYACNNPGSVAAGTRLSFTLPGCPDGGGECLACTVIDFQTEDDFATALVNGQKITTPPEFGQRLAIASAGANAGVAIFDSTPGGPNSPSQDMDLLVDRGNMLILQNSQVPTLTGDVFDRPNDDQDGGDLILAFVAPVEPLSVVLVDIDVGTAQASSVTLTDLAGKTRTYSVPSQWTEDILLNGGSGWRTLDLTTLAPQPGFASVATASEEAGFDATQVVLMVVHLGSSGAIDDLSFCE